MKEEGATNDLFDRIAADPLFAAVHGRLDSFLDPMLFVGRAPQQVDDFLAECVDPILSEHAHVLQKAVVDTVNV